MQITRLCTLISLSAMISHNQLNLIMQRVKNDRSVQRGLPVYDKEFSDKRVKANSVGPEEQSDQSLHCLSFCLHLLDTLLYGKTTLFKLIR